MMGSYKKETYLCSVETGENGKLTYVLADGRSFKSPSSAAAAVMGGKAVNGWVFWTLASGDSNAIVVATPKIKKVIYRQPNQRGVEAGSTRYWCNACMKGFVAEDSAALVCPEVHFEDSPVDQVVG